MTIEEERDELEARVNALTEELASRDSDLDDANDRADRLEAENKKLRDVLESIHDQAGGAL